jgi:hypothetical protein
MLLNAAIATRYPGHDRLAGIWEFLDREYSSTSHAETRLYQRDGSRFVRDAVDKPHVRRYPFHLDRTRSRIDTSFTHFHPLKLDTRLGDWPTSFAGVNAAGAGQAGFSGLDVSA